MHLWFSSDQPLEERRALRVAAENIHGVRRVKEHIVPATVDPAVLEALLTGARRADPSGDLL